MGKMLGSILDPFLGSPMKKSKAHDRKLQEMLAADQANNAEVPNADEPVAQAPTLVDSLTQRDVEMRRRRTSDPTNLTGGRLADRDVYNKVKTILGSDA